MSKKNEVEVEELSAKLHEIYMLEAERQGDVRHDWDYSKLKESTKEYDRVLARFILAESAQLREKLASQSLLIEKLRDGLEWAVCFCPPSAEKNADLKCKRCQALALLPHDEKKERG